ncbi:MAG: sodium:proton antiporter [Jiangellales bacterium]
MTQGLGELLPTALLEMSILLGVAVLVGLFAQKIRLPLTVVLAVAGMLATTLGLDLALIEVLDGEGFKELLVNLFLPILVFEAAVTLSTREFMRNLAAITALATIALLISAALVGSSLVAALAIPVAAALLFGALISATDPVAVVAVFRELGVSRRLLTLVEGESLLNDGVAIVLYSVLLTVALGTAPFGLGPAVGEFVVVAAGGLVVGCLVGGAAVMLLPLLSRLPAAALSVAVAFGSFVLAEAVVGVSGVMATVAAGILIGGMLESRADKRVRDLLHELWESLGFIANALLFLFIGLALDIDLITDNLGAIAIAVAAVLISRPLAVVPVVAVLHRMSHIPRVGHRSTAVVVWGGLRGGVALALALALPDELEQRELFIAMTAGVVLTTLLLNATTLPFLLHFLHLDEPRRSDEHLSALARLLAVKAARDRLGELDLHDDLIDAHLDVAEVDAQEQLAVTDLGADEQVEVLVMRGLHIQRETYQGLADAGLLAPIATRTLMFEIDEEIDEAHRGELKVDAARRANLPWYARTHRRLLTMLPEPLGEDMRSVRYVELSARQLAARRAAEELARFGDLPGIDGDVVDQARTVFQHWEQAARVGLTDMEMRAGVDVRVMHRQQARALTKIAAVGALHQLSEVGIVSAAVADRAARRVEEEIDSAGR